MCRYRDLKLKYILVIFAVLFSCEVFAESSISSVRIFFNLGSNVIVDDRDILKLKTLIDSSESTISHINITGYSSPDGSLARNMELANLRAESVREYIVDQTLLPNSLLSTHNGGVAWSRLQSIIQQEDPSYKDEIVSIIENQPESSRNRSLMTFEEGIPYRYLYNNIYPLLRYVDVEIITQVEEPEPEPEPIVIVIIEPQIVEPVVETQPTPLFAIKTNLLFDIATLLNVEVEIPIKQRWSIAAEYVSAWWIMDNHRANSKRNRLEIINGNLEGRYWFGDRSERSILTGWFAGLYTGVGSYDVEYDAKGYQGEFFIAAGLSGGYAHTINRNKRLRMEYSLGLGYMSTHYKYYHAEYCVNGCWHAIEQRSGNYSWFGPTRAKVSLSWLFNRQAKK